MSTSLQGLARAVMPFDATADPGGIDLMQRAAANRRADQLSQAGLDYGINNLAGGMGQVINQAVHQMGPLPDPRWDAEFQAMSDANNGQPVTLANVRGSRGR